MDGFEVLSHILGFSSAHSASFSVITSGRMTFTLMLPGSRSLAESLRGERGPLSLVFERCREVCHLLPVLWVLLGGHGLGPRISAEVGVRTTVEEDDGPTQEVRRG